MRLVKTNLKQDTNTILNIESLEKIQDHIDSLDKSSSIFNSEIGKRENTWFYVLALVKMNYLFA